MEIFVLSFCIVCLAVLGMAVGALAGRRPLNGGCGSADRADGTGIGRCRACGAEGRLGDPSAAGEDAPPPARPGIGRSDAAFQPRVWS